MSEAPSSSAPGGDAMEVAEGDALNEQFDGANRQEQQEEQHELPPLKEGEEEEESAQLSLEEDEDEDEEEGDDVDEDSQADDGPEENQYEQDGFLVNEGEENDDEGDRKSGRRMEERFIPLEEDDLELIEGRSDKKKRLKRLKKKGESVAIGLPVDDDEELVEVPVDREGGTVRRKHKASREEPEDPPLEEPLDDDDDGFIIGAKRSRTGASSQSASRVTDAQLAEWQSIFGDAQGIEQFWEQSQANAIDGDYNPEMDMDRERDEDDEDGDDLGSSAKQRGESFQEPSSQKVQKPSKLSAMFDPSALQHEFLTENDLRIVGRDRPERLQLRDAGREKPSTDELVAEARWINKRAFMANTHMNEEEQDRYMNAIYNVLFFLHSSDMEIPFIFMYKPDYVIPLDEKQCWTVFAWDSKWYQLSRQRALLQSSFGAHEDEVIQAGLAEVYLRRIASAESEEELKDFSEYFHFYCSAIAERHRLQAAPNSDAEARRPSKRDEYQEAIRRGLVEPASRMAISAFQFGENMLNDQLVNVPVDEDELPEQFAQHYVNDILKTPEEVLAACRSLLARELSLDPKVRDSIRLLYQDHSVVSTEPTDEGILEIDYWHPFRDVKQLEKKPIKQFMGTDKFALIMQAEKENMLRATIEIRCDPLDDMLELYLSKGYGLNTSAWNKLRRQVLVEALERWLHPRMRQEMRKRLEEWTFEHVCEKAGEELKNRISAALPPLEAPLVWESDYVDGEIPAFSRGKDVCVLCVPDTQGEAPYAVIVHRTTGEVRKWLKLSFFDPKKVQSSKKLALNPSMGQSGPPTGSKVLDDDLDKLRELILLYRPSWIGICAFQGALSTLEAFDMLSSFVLKPLEAKLSNSLPRILPRLAFVDARASQVFAKTQEARKEFPEFPPALLLAVSAARSLTHPLAEYARLWDEKMSIQYVSFHQHQHMVPRRMLLDHLEQAFINVTSKLGVDLNHCVAHQHLAGPLCFVPGLGPRKAKHLLRAVAATGREVDRRSGGLKALLSPPAMGSEVVFANAAAFIRFNKKSSQIILDSTRIHPDDYRFAHRIATDALEDDNTSYAGLSLEEVELRKDKLVRRAMEVEKNQTEIQRVDLELLATFWEQTKGEKKALALQMVQQEMLNPFDVTKYTQELQEMSRERLFDIIVGEPLTNYPNGKLVRGVVHKIIMPSEKFPSHERIARPLGILLRLDDGLTGFIRNFDISDEGEVRDMATKVQVGQLLQARIMRVEVENHFRVLLACKSSVLGDLDAFEPLSAIQQAEPFNQWAQAEKARVQLLKERDEQREREARRERARAKATIRVVDHPSFRNCGEEGIVHELQDRPLGEALFRPSTTKGSDFLVLSFKGLGDTVVHVQVAELDKPNEVSLGRKLRIKGGDDYEDLDEVIARYVQPIANLMKQMERHHRWHAGSKDEVDQVVLQEKHANPSTIPYRVGFNHANPGWYLLHYVPGSRVHRAIILIRPNGYRIGSRTFPHLRDLLEWFKKHWQELEKSSAVKKKGGVGGMSRR